MGEGAKGFLFAVLVGACWIPTVSRGWRSSPAAAAAASGAAHSLVRGDYADALARSDSGLVHDPADPWLLYQRGSALAGLGRRDEALEALVLAEAHFSTPHERSLAVYRRALILESWHRCQEASTELSHFAVLARDQQHDLASDALAHLKSCPPRRQDLKIPAEHRMNEEKACTSAMRWLVAGDYQRALVDAQVGLAFAPEDGWLAYIRAAALAGLRRSDDAVDALRVATRLFNREEGPREAVSTYRQVVALENDGDCGKAADELHGGGPATDRKQPDHLRVHISFCVLAAQSRPVVR